MRRWLVLLAGVAVMAVAGTALAMNWTEEPVDHVEATEPTAKVETTTTTIDGPVEPEPISDKLPREDEVEKPGNDEREKPVVKDYVDETPPRVEILHPEDGQVFERDEVVIEGVTEPGARLFAGDHEADVSEDGAFRLVLHLGKGENVLTVKAIDSSGNHATDSVTVIYRAPEKPEATEPKEEHKEEPKEEPKEDPVDWEFSAHQVYGACSETPPYDVFYGTGKPGSFIVIESEFGRKKVEIGKNGEWEAKVYFEGAPLGEAFGVWVVDKFGHEKVFEFIHTA